MSKPTSREKNKNSAMAQSDDSNIKDIPNVKEEIKEEVKDEKQEKGEVMMEEKRNYSPQFGVRCYMHQFYIPEPIQNPGIYEFPLVSTGMDDMGHKQRGNVSILFAVMFFMGISISIVFGVLESVEMFYPDTFAEFSERFPRVQGWVTLGFLAGIMIIILTALLQLLYYKVLAIERYQAEFHSRNEYNTPKYQERIPLREEIQAIQPPQATLMTNIH